MTKNKLLTISVSLFISMVLNHTATAEYGNITDSSGSRVADGSGRCALAAGTKIHPDCKIREPEQILPEPPVVT